MKSVMILLVSVLALPLISFADDNISVSVNGRNFSCSGNGDNIRYACSCSLRNGLAELKYYSVDRSTGQTNLVRTIDAWGSGELRERMDNCNQEKLVNIVCQGL